MALVSGADPGLCKKGGGGEGVFAVNGLNGFQNQWGGFPKFFNLGTVSLAILLSNIVSRVSQSLRSPTAGQGGRRLWERDYLARVSVPVYWSCTDACWLNVTDR